MSIYFGTDGIRGIINNDLSFDVMYKCGNALSQLKPNPTIVIGRDTRLSGSLVTLAISAGAMMGGAKIIDVGIIPTAGIAYLTKKLECDFGVVISASHNPPEFNGIKVFGSDGFKLGDEKENEIEKKFIKNLIQDNSKIGNYSYIQSFSKCYLKELIECGCDLGQMKIVIDASNGASYSIAPKVFRGLNATVITTNCKNSGDKINQNCGSLYPEVLKRNVLKFGADIGFAFDGDADRIVAVDRFGNIYDGDKIVYILSTYFNKLNKDMNCVVGTSHTNMGIEDALNKKGIKLIRSDIGDKYVLEQMLKQNCTIGGEQSGHVILRDYATTGDGILCAVILCKIIKQCGELAKLFDATLYPQININVPVADKMKVINSEILANEIRTQKEKIKGRILVRASGTEPKIRIMVEEENKNMAQEIAKKLEHVVKSI